jgi:hypothetical protein
MDLARPARPALPDPGESRRIVAAGFGHLLRLIGPGGRFTYAHPMGRPDAALPGYNLLRHCGTLWFMLRAVNEGAVDAGRAGQAFAAAVGYIGARLVQPSWLPAPALALRTKEALKLGGAGLALCMLAQWQKFPARPFAALPLPLPDTIAALRAYTLAQIEGDDFRHKRGLATGEVLPFRSDYYTGEALLGLLLTGPAGPELARVTRALIARRYGWAEQSHWMAYAACEAVERGAVAPDEGAAYLTGLAAAILADTAYRDRRQSTPIACRSEALTRLLRLADRRPGMLPGDLRAAARAAVAENLALQRGWHADGQFRKGDGDDKVQIDYIQHNATAWLNLLGLRVPAPDGMPRRGD